MALFLTVSIIFYQLYTIQSELILYDDMDTLSNWPIQAWSVSIVNNGICPSSNCLALGGSASASQPGTVQMYYNNTEYDELYFNFTLGSTGDDAPHFPTAGCEVHYEWGAGDWGGWDDPNDDWEYPYIQPSNPTEQINPAQIIITNATAVPINEIINIKLMARWYGSGKYCYFDNIYIHGIRSSTDTPTTSNPTTGQPTTAMPTTDIPTTGQPTTDTPTTAVPTTDTPTTGEPTTANPTTTMPTTDIPTTDAPTTAIPTTDTPTTSDPTTDTPTTNSPTSYSPTTGSPTTAAPTTAVPTTLNPTTNSPTTSSPTTGSPTTAVPTTAMPTTLNPTSAAPTTGIPTTGLPTTATPTTDSPTQPGTAPPSTALPTTTQPTTANPTTSSPSTEQPTSDAPTTAIPTTDNPTSGAPTTAMPATNDGMVGSMQSTETGSNLGEFGSDDNKSFLDKYLFIIIGGISGFLFFFIIFFLLYYYKNKKKKQKQSKIDKSNIELVTITSTTELITTSDNEGNIAMETTDNTDNVDNVDNVDSMDNMDKTDKTDNNNDDNIDVDIYSNENALKMFLENIELTEYYNLFVAEGFGAKLSMLYEINDNDLKQIGIKKMADRKLILKHINLTKNADVNTVEKEQDSESDDAQGLYNNVNSDESSPGSPRSPGSTQEIKSGTDEDDDTDLLYKKGTTTKTGAGTLK